MSKKEFKDITKQDHQTEHQVVITHNEITELKLTDLTAKQIDLVYALFFHCSATGEEEFILSFKNLVDYSLYKNSNTKFLRGDLIEAGKKIVSIYSGQVKDNKISFKTVFESYEVGGPGNPYLKVKFTPSFAKLLKADPQSNGYTKSWLDAMVKLTSLSSKGLYLILCRFNNTKGKKSWWKASREDFRDYLMIKDSYTDSHVKTQIIPKVVEELSPIFKDLKIEEIRGGITGGKGKLTGYYCSYISNPDLFPNSRKEQKADLYIPKHEETPYICTACGKPFYKIEKKDGSYFYGHKSTDIKETGCKLSFNSLILASEHSKPLMERGDKFVVSDRFETVQERNDAMNDYFERQRQEKGDEGAMDDMIAAMKVGLSIEDLLDLEKEGALD